MKCEYLRYRGITGQNNGYECTHPDIYKSAKLYEESHTYIHKSVDYIGHKEPKTCLRWCPKKTEVSSNG